MASIEIDPQHMHGSGPNAFNALAIHYTYLVLHLEIQ